MEKKDRISISSRNHPRASYLQMNIRLLFQDKTNQTELIPLCMDYYLTCVIVFRNFITMNDKHGKPHTGLRIRHFH